MNTPSLEAQIKALQPEPLESLTQWMPMNGGLNGEYNYFCLGYQECQGESSILAVKADARIARLETALRDLVKCNEDHNADMLKILPRPWNWNDSYLDAARMALEQP